MKHCERHRQNEDIKRKENNDKIETQPWWLGGRALV